MFPCSRRVSFRGERLIWVQAHMDASKLGVDEQGNTVVLDFGEIALLPESFATYTLSSYHKFAHVPVSLGWSGESNQNSMVRISGNLMMTGEPSLGAST